MWTTSVVMVLIGTVISAMRKDCSVLDFQLSTDLSKRSWDLTIQARIIGCVKNRGICACMCREREQSYEIKERCNAFQYEGRGSICTLAYIMKLELGAYGQVKPYYLFLK
jgi:hypothetical protein